MGQLQDSCPRSQIHGNFLLEPQRATPYIGGFSAGRNDSGKPRIAECAEYDERLTASAERNGLAVMNCSSQKLTECRF